MSKILICITALLVLPLEKIKSARILAVFPTPSISHQIVFRPLTRELARGGHEITIITTDPLYPSGQAPYNLIEIDVHNLSYTLLKEEIENNYDEKKRHLKDESTFIIETMSKIIRAQTENEEVQDIINNKRDYFDLLLLEAFFRPLLIYSHLFKVPVILISSFGGTTLNLRAVGVTTHPILYPDIAQQKLYNLNNWDKLRTIYNSLRAENIKQVEEQAHLTLKSKFGSDVPSLQELSNNVHMLFLNVNPIWVDNQPVPTNVVYIGGIHVTPQKKLPKDLQTFLDSSKNGVVYFSLGTNVKTSTLPPETVQMFLRVFSQLPYDILWKWDQDELPGRTKNIKISQWFPQLDLLNHQNIKVFVTQGGLQSTDEAISAGVPLIGIPLLGDQWYNVQKYVRHQIGVQLDIATLTDDKFKRAIETVTGDKRYRENMVRLHTLMTDQPRSPLERAVWWTEYTLRHGGAAHLRAASANVSWAQYLELEFVSTVVSILLLVFALIFTCWKIMILKTIIIVLID